MAHKFLKLLFQQACLGELPNHPSKAIRPEGCPPQDLLFAAYLAALLPIPSSQIF